MEYYNKIMLYFWLSVAVISGITITYLCFTEGFDRWSYYYVVPVVSLMMYLVRRWMMKRMKKHLEFLENQRKGGQK
ncbi:MAG: hypothetical protein EP338_07780 [Bacteroidetes bacterium]|nr:MAG: hypothetical protein EP338_07780 [Bacteroidota bacterium]